MARQAADIGTAFRVVGEAAEPAWPVNPVPLLIDADAWVIIATGVSERAALLETVLADLYGSARLVREGHVPAALVTGSAYYLRSMTRLVPPGGHPLHHVAFALARGPDGEWRVLAVHLRAPIVASYALENRLAVSRARGRLRAWLSIQRHAPFFAALRDGLAAPTRRARARWKPPHGPPFFPASPSSSPARPSACPTSRPGGVVSPARARWGRRGSTGC